MCLLRDNFKLTSCPFKAPKLRKTGFPSLFSETAALEAKSLEKNPPNNMDERKNFRTDRRICFFNDLFFTVEEINNRVSQYLKRTSKLLANVAFGLVDCFLGPNRLIGNLEYGTWLKNKYSFLLTGAKLLFKTNLKK